MVYQSLGPISKSPVKNAVKTGNPGKIPDHEDDDTFEICWNTKILVFP